MLVKELKKVLENCNDNDLVVLSIDQEGNGYNELSEIDTAYSFKDGEIGLRELSEEMWDLGYEDEDLAPKDAKPCIVLWP